MTAHPTTVPNCQELAALERKAMFLRAYNLTSIFAAGSGHSGGTLSIADITAALYFCEAKVNSKDPHCECRDRIYYSAGHKAPAQYTALAMAGFFPVETAMTLRKFDSICQGHPHSLKCPGIEISSGSLGQGLGVAVGTALGLRLNGSSSRVYCIMGDGEQQEGSIWEAAMSAGHYKLDNLCGIVDYNRLQIDGDVHQVMNITPLDEKYRAFGWNVIECDGHAMHEIMGAFIEARNCKGKPTLIIAHTVKGKGVSFMENVAGWHGIAPKTREEFDKALLDIMGKDVFSREEVDRLLGAAKSFAQEKTKAIDAKFPSMNGFWWNDGSDMKVKMDPTRFGFGRGLKAIGDDERLVTIHVDISGSICITEFEKDHPERKSRVFSLGIAEQNMIQVAAGLARTGKIPVAGDYGVFACGRCWDQIRTSVCYPNLNVKIAGAHAGISVGADGATHQALEEISLCAILPNMTLIVPCDSIETEKLTKQGLLDVVGPTYLRYAREATPVVTNANTPCVLGKANVMRFRGKQPNFADAFETVLASDYKAENEALCIIACGPMVPEAMRAAVILKETKGIETRIVNIHTVKPIDKQAISAAANEVGCIITAEEHQVGAFGGMVASVINCNARPVKMDMVGVQDRFGESGQPWELMKAFELTAEHIVKKSLALLK